MGVVVHNLQEAVPLPEGLAETASRAVARALELEGYGGATEVSLVFVDDERIRELNRDYRGVDRATDVLAFPMHEEEPGSAPGEGPVLLLGDIVISLPTAVRQAEACGHGLPYEVAHLAVHGALHLLGYDHDSPGNEQTMRAKEEDVLTKLNLGR